MIWIIIFVLIITIAAFLLPFIAKALVNRSLRKIDGYKGRIDRLRINLFGSEINLHDLTIRKYTDRNPTNTFLIIPKITVLFKWSQLLRSILDIKIIVTKPKLFFVAEAQSSEGENIESSHELPNLKDQIEKLMPFIVTVEIQDGQMQFDNTNSRPPLQINAAALNVSIQDFSNRLSLSKSSTILGTCTTYEGIAEIIATLVPLEPTLTVDLNMQLKSINLVLLNDLFRTYAKVDINRGTLDLFSEVAVNNNSFKGYIKPVLRDLDFISAEDHNDNIIQKMWERVVAGFYNVLENSRNEQVATKIPIEGRLDDPNVHLGAAIVGILRNAFVKALTPSFDNVVNIKSIWSTARSETQAMFKSIFNSES